MAILSKKQHLEIIQTQMKAAMGHCKAAIKQSHDPNSVSLEAGLALENLQLALDRVYYVARGRWPE